MSPELIIAIITALVAGPAGAIVNNILNRDKEFIAKARELMSEYKDQADRLQVEVEALKAVAKTQANEIEAQAAAIENLAGENLRHQLIAIILFRQLRLANITPAIKPDEVSTIPINELRDIAEGLSNSDRRREEAQARKAGKK